MTEQVPPSTSSGEGRPPAGPSATTPVPQPRPADQPVPGGQPGHPAPGAPPGQPVTPGYAAPGAPPGYGTPPGYGARPGHPVPGPPPTSPGGQPLASFTDRLLAVLIDGAILGGIGLVCAIPAVIIFFVAVGPELTAVEYQPDGAVATPDLAAIIVPLLLMEAALFAVMLVVQYVYSVEMSRRTGQTVGKRVMKIRIAPLDPTGSLTRGVLARRFLAQLGCGLVPGMSYVDGLWQLWDKPYQQCLHDKFARTVVVKVPA